MPCYQIYLLDQQERICKRIDRECRDDAGAMAAARQHLGLSTQAEVWIGIRLLGRVHEADRLPLAAPTKGRGGIRQARGGMLARLAIFDRFRSARPNDTGKARPG